jgi:hypothetical protein
MKKYIKPSVEVLDMEMTNCIMQVSTLPQQGDYDSSSQSVLESRRRDARSEY